MDDQQIVPHILSSPNVECRMSQSVALEEADNCI